MIVVLGRPGLGVAVAGGSQPLDGLAALVALAAVDRGARVELVGTVGEDQAGDAVMVALGAAGVGHAAVLRDPAGVTPGGAKRGPQPRLDAGDIGLGLQFVPECRVLVVAEDLDEAAASATIDAAAYHGAPVVAIVSPGAPVPDAWDRGATVLSAPEEEGDDEPVELAPFARLVAGFALGLAEGRPVSEALSRAVSGAGWERAGEP